MNGAVPANSRPFFLAEIVVAYTVTLAAVPEYATHQLSASIAGFDFYNNREVNAHATQ